MSRRITSGPTEADCIPITDWTDAEIRIYDERKRLANLDMTHVFYVEERAGAVAPMRQYRILKRHTQEHTAMTQDTTRICYIDDSIRPGADVKYGDLEDCWRPGLQPIALIEHTLHSDYSGSGAVEASNLRVLLANETIAPTLFRIYGGHGTRGLAYEAYLGPVPFVEELAEILDGLDDYPLIDDDDHSELEMELETEAWETSYGGRHDFRKALTKLLDAIEPGYDHEIPGHEAVVPPAVAEQIEAETWGELLDALWRQGCESFNVNGGTGYTVEQGGVVYFFIDEWCEKGLDKRSAKMADELAAVARASRSSGLKIKLSPSDDDGMVTVYCDDKRAAKDDQDIEGSRWEAPKDMDVAYASIMDGIDLLERLKADGYEVDDDEYSPPDEDDIKRWAAKLERDNAEAK